MPFSRLLTNAANFTKCGKDAFLNKLETLEKISAVIIACVDSRVFPTKFLGIEFGEAFLARNPGNFVPESSCTEYNDNTLATLELGCVRHDVKNIIICGHSDCKAMKLLHTVRPTAMSQQKSPASSNSPLERWVVGNGEKAFKAFSCNNSTVNLKTVDGLRASLSLNLNAESFKKLGPVDQLSQINLLHQLAHVYTHPMLQDRLQHGGLQVYAIWFSINEACLHLYSRVHQEFVPVTEATLDELLEEVDE